MIKKMRSSLFVKVFIITTLLLLFVSLMVFGILAWIMPETYSQELNNGLDTKVMEFVSELEQSTLENSGGLFDQFISANDISNIELYSQSGEFMSIPTMQQEIGGAQGNSAENTAISGYAIPTLSSTYYFSFLNSAERYTLVVYGEAAQIAELQRSFAQIFPVILITIVVIALFASWLYSRIITFPVLKISKISTQMSDMQLDWDLEQKRTDELGTLEKSLNTLSKSLSTALSDLKNANAKLEADIEHEKALEQAQIDFFSAASHELKTPITVIKGQLEGMLLGIGAYKDREKYLSRSLEVVNTLETMVQELLTISRLQTSNADFKSDCFDCVPIIQGYLRDTEDLIVNKELQIYLDIPASVLVNGNRLLIEKVFSNLIGNAIKYSPQGAAIVISIHEQQAKHLFCIENSGTHIPEEAISKIFEAFYRVDQSRSRKTGGSGLGLYIVQKILQQHGSYCSVCNAKAGVQFSFEIP